LNCYFGRELGERLASPANEMTPETILSQYEAELAALGSRLRKFLLKHLPGIIEQPDAKANLIGYSYGPGYKDLICTIMISKKGVKLGFYKSGELSDPQHLLTGSGKVHKYVEIKSGQDISNPALLALLKQAAEGRLKRAAARKP
jgi:hypothetical protein